MAQKTNLSPSPPTTPWQFQPLHPPAAMTDRRLLKGQARPAGEGRGLLLLLSVIRRETNRSWVTLRASTFKIQFITHLILPSWVRMSLWVKLMLQKIWSSPSSNRCLLTVLIIANKMIIFLMNPFNVWVLIKERKKSKASKHTPKTQDDVSEDHCLKNWLTAD